MTMKMNWKKQSTDYSLHFGDLPLNSAFKIDSPSAKGAVYIKVQTKTHISYGKHEQYMYEIATGKLFTPTTSRVRSVNVEINVDSDKPDLYG